MYITIILKSKIEDFLKKIEIVCQNIDSYIKSDYIDELIEEVICTYKNDILNQEKSPENQLNQMINSHIYNEPLYKDGQIEYSLYSINKDDVMAELHKIKNIYFNKEAIYIYQFTMDCRG